MNQQSHPFVLIAVAGFLLCCLIWTFLSQPRSLPAAQSPLPTIALPPDGADILVVGIDSPDSISIVVDDQHYRVKYAGIDGLSMAANTALVLGKKAWLEQDVADKDAEGQAIRYVWLAGGRMVNEELLKLGCAHINTDPRNVKYQERFLLAEATAIKQGRKCTAEAISSATATQTPRATAPSQPVVQQPKSLGPQDVSGFTNLAGYIVAIRDTKLRVGPGTSYSVLAKFGKGTKAVVVGCQASPCAWYLLAGGDWIDAADVVFNTPERPTPSPTPSPTPRWGVIAVELLNVRSQPSKNGPIVDTLPEGTCVPVLDIQPEWVKVKSNVAQIGWCWRQYVQIVVQCPPPAETPSSTPTPTSTPMPNPTRPPFSLFQAVPDSHFVRYATSLN